MSVRLGRARLVGSNVPAAPGRAAPCAQILLLVSLSALLGACGGPDGEGGLDLRGSRLEVVAVWQDAEAESFELVLDRFEQDTGATVSFSSTGGEDITAVLGRRLEAGDPPDVAVLPQPGLLARYARSGEIVPIDDIVGDRVRASWAPIWRQLGSVDGELYGVWFKAANKSLIWYSLSAYERSGLVPPTDLAGLTAAARTLAADGTPAFSLPGAAGDAWVLTDWFENLYLRIAGPERYDLLAEHRIPWTHPTVAETLRAMAALLDPSLVVRAPESTFPETAADVFATRPRVGMVMEGDFVPGVVGDSTDAEIGVDVDVVAFPGLAATDRYVVGGGDAAVLMESSPAGEALLAYLASSDAAAVWASRGGFVSPNEDLDLNSYPDAATRRIARALLEAGDGFRFDLSDLQPVELGATTGAGLWAELSAFVSDPTDIEGTMTRLEAAADAAWATG